MRSSHAANNGKIFSWNNPPPTGHPGETYGCRCWAEAFNPDDAENRVEFRNQVVTNFIPDVTSPWNTADYTLHYSIGNGKPVTLQDTGQLLNIITYAITHLQPKGGTIFERFSRDIFERSREEGEGRFTLNFDTTYDLRSVVVAFRDSTIGGNAAVTVTDRGHFLIINADINYYFRDRYTDPFDLGDHSDKPRGSDEINDDYGTPYDITGEWSSTLTALIIKDSTQSKYPDDEFGR